MKKSLLVVPALGVMLLAAAGSVGGTVAWFSSVSSVSAGANTFQAKAIGGNLSLKMQAGQGTEIDTTNAEKPAAKVLADSFLTHASFDHKAKEIYTRSSENTNGVRKVITASEFAGSAFSSNETAPEQDDDWFAKKSDKIYWAVTWKMTFTYTFATEFQVNLYFDPASTLEKTSTATTGQTDMNTYKGFRIAFVGQEASAANTRIWAKERTEGTAGTGEEQAKFIKGGSGSFDSSTYWKTGDAYDTGEVIDKKLAAGNKTARPEGKVIATDDSSSFDCLGKFVRASGTSATLTFVCVAWYEGTDSEIKTVDNMALDKVSASMVFYAREVAVS